MTPTCQILQGDVRQVLATLPENSVQCCVTSPPYWNLRDYGVAGQIGLERTPEEYVAELVKVFREVRRVLREDGVLWLNLGDSYAASGRGGGGGSFQDNDVGTKVTDNNNRRAPVNGYKCKDLVGIPWMVAFALRSDGWYLRSWAPWIKRNVMPESVEDRPGTAVETFFLLTKSEHCYYDHIAVKKAGAIPSGTRAAKGSSGRGQIKDVNGRPPEYWEYTGERNRRNSDWFFESWQGLLSDEEGNPLAFVVNTRPYAEAHFATFPPDLVKPCILAGTSAKGCCPKCGEPRERIVETSPMEIKRSGRGAAIFGDNHSTAASGTMIKPSESRTIDWKPACRCYCVEDTPDPIPCTVLDPFGGSGTTGQVAIELGRNAILVELNPEYVKLATQRTHVTPGLPLA